MSIFIFKRTTKLFSYRDPDPSKYMFDLENLYLTTFDDDGNEVRVKAKAKVHIDVEESGKYKSQLQEALPPLREEIKKIRKGIKEGNLYKNSSPTEDTHSLGRDTAKYNPITKGLESVVWSKQINGGDRLNYRVYKPEWVSAEGEV